MLYSEVKERENRFITALKIVFPFLLLLGIFFHSFQLHHNALDIYLIILLIPIYVYYTVYLIYNGFQTTLIDAVTKTFNREKIIHKIKKIKNTEHTTIVLLHVKNLNDINERYGLANGDVVLKQFIQKLQQFLEEHHFKNVPIGRYSNINFIVIIPFSPSELKHLLTIFIKSIQNVGIDNIEIKVNFSLLKASYDSSVENLIERLLVLVEEQIKNGDNLPNIKPDALKMVIEEAMKHNDLLFKYQPCIAIQNSQKMIYEVLTRIESKEHGTLLKHQIQRIVNHAGYEKEFDEKVFSLLLEEIEPLLTSNEIYFSIEVSPVSLRNNSFKRFLATLFEQKKINPNHFILEIIEKKSYEEMHRFSEIIKAYHDMGFKIALGNFGGNNSSLEYLKQLSIDMVKFDIEFTKNSDDLKYQELLSHYIKLCQTLHIQSMVKFVDKEALFEKIKRYEPDFIQGFYISKPKNLEHIIKDNL